MKITKWESGIGASIEHKGLHLEVWEHGGVTRCIPAKNLCGLEGTHHTRVETGTFEQMAQRAVISWQTSRRNWRICD